ncbi:zinc finger-containing ubiquitin peptidase 1-like [Cololabis saira]|uniref:zinc finger-containing ubiquitin peptidase 1-like n=1 Tax=Cololabis saira TaxID=129043 RepID=UPI002AD59C05|nr:zinc finger-containing ubiquitin peptidase 1-like [Cololabis saira]
MGGISRGAGEAVLFDASMVRTDLVPSRQRSSAGVSCSSQEETPLIPAAMTTQDSKGKSKHVKAQPLLPSSSKREKVFSCPMCSLVCSSSFILQEHVELHLQEQHSDEGWTPDSCSAPVTSHPASSPSGGRRLECPLCSAVFSHSFSLQEHVELHLDPGSAGNCTGSLDGDLQLATRLQQQEESRRQEQARQEDEQSRSLATRLQQEEEARQEREDFHKLQRQFGLDGSGGYRQQMERTMERAVARGVLPPAHFHLHKANMMESLASGVDDGATRTQGVIPALREYYQSQALDCVHVWLAADTDHYSSSGGDKGWGCGYRNFQMLLSSLSNIDPYSTHLQGRAVPCIPQLQTMIEEAWKEGLDPQGASHFNQQLQGTRAWIGATEIYVLLTSLGISARIMDFHKPTGPAGTHPLLFDWVREYFSQSNRSSRLPPRFIQTCLPPLYLQHQGHSRSVVGLEQRKNGVLCLLLFDPGCPPSHSSKLLSRSTVGGALRRLRIFPRSLKHQQYQLVAVESTVLSAEEKQVIYVARNPKDVLVSYYHFHKVANMLETPKSFDDFFEKFLRGEVFGCSWFEHIKNWYSHKDEMNMLVIMYEEMIQDLRSAIKRISMFLGKELTEEQLASMVKHSTFSTMRKNPQANYEQVSGELLSHHLGRFMRKGTVGDWKNHFSVAQNQRFDQLFQREMKEFPLSFIWDMKDLQ